ncbi:unnamed protein product [Euphydryas editha]|uniref:Uncharacterized protein n=1 Tax=Euphydryas editha TaxID=104508 RepID=A0AAU9UHQ0_EUPED|nr:unnamed protein product [Euphydryas editha]
MSSSCSRAHLREIHARDLRVIDRSRHISKRRYLSSDKVSSSRTLPFRSRFATGAHAKDTSTTDPQRYRTPVRVVPQLRIKRSVVISHSSSVPPGTCTTNHTHLTWRSDHQVLKQFTEGFVE